MDSSIETSDPLWTVPQLAEYLGTTPPAIYLMRHRRQAPPAIRIGSLVRFRKSDVDAWLKAHAEEVA